MKWFLLLTLFFSSGSQASHFGLFFHGGLRFTEFPITVLPTEHHYQVQRKDATKLKIVDLDTSTIFLDNVGTYVNEGDVQQTCYLTFTTFTIPLGTTLDVHEDCKWLVMKVNEGLVLNGTLTARNLSQAGGTFTSRKPGVSGLTGDPISYTVVQNAGGKGGDNYFVIFDTVYANGGAAAYGNGGQGGGEFSGDYFYNGHGAAATENCGGGHLGIGPVCSPGANGQNSYRYDAYGGSNYPGGGGGRRGAHGQGIYIDAVITGSGSINVQGTKGGNGGNGYDGGGYGSFAAPGGAGAGGSGGKIVIHGSSSATTVVGKGLGGVTGGNYASGSFTSTAGGAGTDGNDGSVVFETP